MANRDVTNNASNPNKTALILADKVLIVDTETVPHSLKEAEFSDLLKIINLLTADASPDGATDYVLTYDTSSGAPAKVLPHNLLKVVNGLTADATPDALNDFLLSFDVSAGTAKKVNPNNLFHNVQNWTPTWTNLVVGAGSVVAKYLQVGKFTIFHTTLVFAADTTISGTVSFSLPTTPATLPVTLPVAISRYKDATGGAAIQGSGQISPSATTIIPTIFDASGTYLIPVGMTATVPFTWAVNDDFEITGLYISA